MKLFGHILKVFTVAMFAIFYTQKMYEKVYGMLADQSGRGVLGMNSLCSLERWYRGFESHSRH
jgi:hypothetical protein